MNTIYGWTQNMNEKKNEWTQQCEYIHTMNAHTQNNEHNMWLNKKRNEWTKQINERKYMIEQKQKMNGQTQYEWT